MLGHSLDSVKSFWCAIVFQSSPTLWDPMDCSTPGFPVHHQLSELTQTHVHWVGDAIQPSHPVSSPSPPAFNLSQHQGLFQWVGSSHQVAKVLEFQLQHQSFQWIFRLISFRMDWLDLLAVQGTLKSVLQHHSSKASILWHSAFFIVQLSHLYDYHQYQIPESRVLLKNVWSHIYQTFDLSFLNFHFVYVCEGIIWVAKEKLRKHVLHSRSYNVEFLESGFKPRFQSNFHPDEKWPTISVKGKGGVEGEPTTVGSISWFSLCSSRAVN